MFNKVLIGTILCFFFASAQAQVCGDLFTSRPALIAEKTKIEVDGLERRLQIFKPSDSKRVDRVFIYFHGTNLPVDLSKPVGSPYGAHNESDFIRELVNQGYVVLAPDANLLSSFIPLTFIPVSFKAWEANISPYSESFESSRDAKLTAYLLDHVMELAGLSQAPSKIFVGGFSSGGYMTSRIGNLEAFARRISGLIINAASFGTCLAASCRLPDTLPRWHPPTLLLSNKNDSVVPFSTVESYAQLLQDQKIPVDTLFNSTGDHSWLPEQIAPILEWLENN